MPAVDSLWKLSSCNNCGLAMLAARSLVLGIRYLASAVWCQVQVARACYQFLSPLHQVPGTRYPVPGTFHLIPGACSLAPGT